MHKPLKYYNNKFIWPLSTFREIEVSSFIKQFNKFNQYRSIIELGSGTGTYSKILKNKTKYLTLLDSCKESLKINKNSNSKINKKVNDFQDYSNHDLIVAIGLVDFLDRDDRHLLFKQTNENQIDIVYSFIPNNLIGHIYKIIYYIIFKQKVILGKLPKFKNEKIIRIHLFRSMCIKKYS